MKNLYKIEDELYIVSNTESISENCWIITNGRLVQVSYLLSDEVAKGFKVILTTNKLLIKDGVQAIDDEFIGCDKKPKQETIYNFYCGNEVDFNEQCQKQCDKCVNATGVCYGKLNIKQETIEEAAEKHQFNYDNLHEAKEIISKIKVVETLEEAKQNYLNKCVREGRLTGYCDEDFEAGAKWQQRI